MKNIRIFHRNRVLLTLFCIALISRLCFLFFIVPIDPYWDSYHHWQIAYYTLQIGLKHGRMWDLTGMEYYWGILPELVEAFLMGIFGTASMLPFRCFNAIIGSFSVCLVYAIMVKYFNDKKMGVISAILTAFWPSILIFNTYGLAETLGIFFLLLSLLFYDKKEYLCGLALGFASMCRIEYWFLTIGVIGCYLVFERSFTRFIPAIAGWLTPMLPYFWILQAHTGSAFYPVYWTFFGTVLGKWGEPYRITTITVIYRFVWLLIAIVCGFVILTLIRKKTREYIVYTLFLGYLTFQGMIAIFSLKGELVGVRYILDRFMMLNYIFMSILLSILFIKLSRLKKIPLKFRVPSEIVYSLLLIALYSLAFTAFLPIYTQQGEMYYYFEISDWLTRRYNDGTILCNIPMMNYRLINNGIPCQNIFGTLYISHNNYTAAMIWFKQYNVKWFVLTYYSYDDSNRLYNFLQSTNQCLPFKLEYAEGIIYIYSVNQTQIEQTTS